MALTIDETPTQPGEWGFRPENVTTEETPPAFVWRPQEDAATYDIQCAREGEFLELAYEASGLAYTVHRPPETYESGTWFWRFRFANGDGNVSEWSSAR
ncbi:MAG: hypothetical protein QGG64_07010, partial [Candidatus Latescibacteria bacterium]|nr:hypothetical protein [Candidatus Latescibacterota bacterium]